MSNSETILAKRKQFVPNAIGIFNPSTAASASGSTIIDADGKELIDFAGGIGVVKCRLIEIFKGLLLRSKSSCWYCITKWLLLWSNKCRQNKDLLMS